MNKISLILFNILLTHCLFASTKTQPRVITEILCNDYDDTHIFTCKVIENYSIEDRIYHKAILDKSYKGDTKDTITFTINQPISSTTKNHILKLMPGSKHLIFCRSETDGIYKIAYGQHGNSGILNVKINEDYKEIESRSKAYLKIVEEYYDKVKTKYTGDILLSAEGYISTTGQFINGKPDGKWIHKSLSQKTDCHIVAHYSKGIREGYRYKACVIENDTIVKSRSLYINGSLELEEYFAKIDPSKVIKEYETLQNDIYVSSRKTTFTLDRTISTTRTKLHLLWFLDYKELFHGEYLEWTSRSNAFGVGNYHYGARIGQWKFITLAGEIDTIITYPQPKKTKKDLAFYHENGKIFLEGDTLHGKVHGEWSHYNKTGQLINKLHFENGLFSGLFLSSNKSTTQYLKHKKHGEQNFYNGNGDLIGTYIYKNHLKNGPAVSYYDNGNKKYKATYKDGIKIGDEIYYGPNGSIIRKNYFDDKGAKLGFHKSYSSKGRILGEGYYLNGYKKGAWKNYNKAGEIEEVKYESDLESLMKSGTAKAPQVKIIKYNPK